MRTISPEIASGLIDFAPADAALPAALGQTQLEGAVAVFNMLVRNRCAYLADEVGMGKTYIALGVMSLLRYFNPKARVLIIAPRANIQFKWQKELTNFVRRNWRHVDNRVKSLQESPDWQPVVCDNLIRFVHEALLHPDRDFLLRMTSFSVRLAQDESRQKLREALRKEIRWLPSGALRAQSFDRFRDAFGAAVNAVVPPIDLLIVDEAHNLKHGFGENTSTRNRVLGFAFGHPAAKSPEDRPWYRLNLARRVLLLSATPFEEDYGAIQRQFDIFGFGHAKVTDATGQIPRSLADLTDPTIPNDEKREIVKRLMVRRVSGFEIGGQFYTKNMYRREWRNGGYERHDEPMTLVDKRQRLVIALMQKKVAEVLQDQRFNNRFQIGMLSSFESFLETVQSSGRRTRPVPTGEDGEDPERVFDGNQSRDDEERRGIDTGSIAEIVESYRRRFGRSLPHPKLDATAHALETAFESGEKALVFVRRIRTVDELAAKLDTVFDTWIRRRMEDALPELKSDIGRLFERYELERSRRPEEQREWVPIDDEERESDDEQRDTEDKGGAETFFAWFFRGKGPPGYLSGAAFQRNRMTAASSAYTTLFEDDYIAWLLGYPAKVIEALSAATALGVPTLLEALRTRAFNHFRRRSRQKEGYPRQYVFEAYQIAGLELLRKSGGELGERADVVLQERYPIEPGDDSRPPAGFPAPVDAIGITTFFTELARRPQLRQKLWPDEASGDFRTSFLRREQRRELLSAMARLGASYIDLYLLAIRPLGSFRLKRESESGRPNEVLAREFADLLEAQAQTPGFHAFNELSNAAEAFDLILRVNFPDVPTKRLDEIAALYGAALQGQVPVGRMSGGVNKRLVGQFRMPGFPIVLVTTDVLQEGEDLHTFCRRVAHYGITWTASAMEQRTGRIDRVGSLVQRQIHGRTDHPTPDEFIQVYYPHLRDTVEVLQVRTVLRRLNRFLRLIHEMSDSPEDKESHIDVGQEVLEDLSDIKQITGPLESAFPVDSWMEGNLGAEAVEPPVFDGYYAHLDTLWRALLERECIDERETGSRRIRKGVFYPRCGSPGGREGRGVLFQVELRSQTSGHETLLRCSARAGQADLRGNEEHRAKVYELQQKLRGAKICIRRNERDLVEEVSIEGDILFHPRTTQLTELVALCSRSIAAAGSLAEILEALPESTERAPSPPPSA
jgi:hypothetical protein